ncbi:hypothetical protein [Streptomyces asoensis]|uniref:Uncharacterized protein n=1 Tax=Streptomyces asoensis TaxID=249586 RepID=A0ABQ3RYV1_9ACTN|nr:hypothetical protein [Streptomyces asoensis]GGQ48604.1 hypothetical protein GCM10010496_08560 [Streptomyces asoensis]GHI61048.1 hypothetical protein Saso_26980 [Streptomyces asoensis]
MTGRKRRRAPPAEPAYVPGQLLDWRDSSHWDYDGPRPCRYCEQPTQLRDSHGSHAHKVCAEDALTQQARDAQAAYHQNGPR